MADNNTSKVIEFPETQALETRADILETWNENHSVEQASWETRELVLWLFWYKPAYDIEYLKEIRAANDDKHKKAG